MKTILVALAAGCFGFLSGAEAVTTDPFGYFPGGNTAEGDKALFNVFGPGATYNTAIGYLSLKTNVFGDFNTGVGAGTLLANTADQNTATGAGALLSNTAGSENTANGALALFYNTTGGSNTANGVNALFRNTTGDANTANGGSALASNIDGINNTAIGVLALAQNIGGGSDTAIGIDALYSNTDGSDNTAIGGAALASNTTGNGNTAVGSGAGANLTTGNNNIDIGNAGIAAESHTIRIGTAGTQTATYMAGIFGATLMDGAPVLVDTNGHLGTAVSSARFKNEIKPMDKASEAILSLKPVTFRYKVDTKGTPQFGLIAEEVAEVSTDLIIRDSDGKPYTVRYDAVNAMLLNEFLKEHRKVEEQQGTIGQLKSNAAKQKVTISEFRKDMRVLTARMKQQAAQIQKVSAQIELSRPVLRMAVSKP